MYVGIRVAMRAKKDGGTRVRVRQRSVTGIIGANLTLRHAERDKLL